MFIFQIYVIKVKDCLHTNHKIKWYFYFQCIKKIVFTCNFLSQSIFSVYLTILSPWCHGHHISTILAIAWMQGQLCETLGGAESVVLQTKDRG
jgi:hypothetical protein